ncbi:MAG: hypothetical protein KKG75_01105, partial [Nanoarchaeota archaeon]|nr:hypothetical protein [Nanoarchaeota archaeon]
GSIEKTEEKMEKELDCSGVEIDLVDVCVNSLESTSEVGLNIDVVGDDGVKGVTIKFIGADGSVETKDYDVETPLFVPNRLLAAKDKLSLDNVISNIVEVEIYPKTEKGELCKDKVESTKKIIKC